MALGQSLTRFMSKFLTAPLASGIDLRHGKADNLLSDQPFRFKNVRYGTQYACAGAYGQTGAM